MKHLILLGILLVSALGMQAQRYQSQYLLTVYELEADGITPNLNKPFLISPGNYFDVVSQVRSYVLLDSVSPVYLKGTTFSYRVVSILPWHEGKGDTEKAKLLNKQLEGTSATVDTDNNGLIDDNDQPGKAQQKEPETRKVFFCLPSKDYDPTGLVQIHRLSLEPTPKIGTVVFPVKLRLGNRDDQQVLMNDSLVATNARTASFATDVTLGTSFGMSWRLSRTQERHLTLLFSAGVTSITLDSTSIPGRFSNAQPKSAAFSLATGLMFEFGNGGQIGAVMGWDILGGETGRYWRYEKKPWLGVGIGIQLFSQTVGDSDDVESNLRNVAHDYRTEAKQRAEKKKKTRNSGN